MDARGKILLKVTGIFLMLGGVLNFIVGVIGFFGGGLGAILGSNTTVSPDMAATEGIILIGYSLGCLVYGVISFAAGFYGFKFAEDVYKARLCINLGIVLIVVSLIVTIFNVLKTGFGIGTITGEIVPILYLVGAVLNKQKV